MDRRHPSAHAICPGERGAVRTGVLLLQTTAVEAGSGSTQAAAASADRRCPSLLTCCVKVQVKRSVKTRYCHTLAASLFLCQTCPSPNSSRLKKLRNLLT